MPQDDEEFLDWSENQTRPRGRQLLVDAALLGIILVFAAGLILLLVFWWRGWRL